MTGSFYCWQNVHMVIKKRSDIEKYVGERYRVASEIAYTVMEFLGAQPKGKPERYV